MTRYRRRVCGCRSRRRMTNGCARQTGGLSPGESPGRKRGPPRAEDQPVVAIDEIVRQREGLFGEAGQTIADLAGERGKPNGHIGDHGECGIDLVTARTVALRSMPMLRCAGGLRLMIAPLPRNGSM